MSEFLIYSPRNTYKDRYDFCELLNSSTAPASASNNNVVVAAVAGKRIRVVSFSLMSQNNVDSLTTFRTGSSGTVIYRANASSNTKPNERHDIPGDGIMETELGVGLFCDSVLASFITVRYFAYTP